MQLKKIGRIARETASQWSDDNAANWAASLAFYTMVSVGPLLFTIVSVAGMFYGKSTAQDAVLKPFGDLMGTEAADALATMMNEAGKTSSGLIGTVVGLVVLVFGATGVFAAMQDAMNAIWNVQPKPGAGALGFLKRRLLSVGMVLGLGFLLLVSLVLNTAITSLWDLLGDKLAFIAQPAELTLAFLLTTLLLGAIFKTLPDAQVGWRSVWVASAATAFLLMLGKAGIALYLGKTNAASAYGAAGSLALILLWVYYAAQILFLGAEFAQVYAAEVHGAIEPKPGAMAVETVPVEDARGRDKKRAS